MSNFLVININDRNRTIPYDSHLIPFTRTFLGISHRFGQGIQYPGYMVIILEMPYAIINLHFISSVYSIPGIGWHFGQTKNNFFI